MGIGIREAESFSLNLVSYLLLVAITPFVLSKNQSDKIEALPYSFIIVLEQCGV
jgi:hypothetical protein